MAMDMDGGSAFPAEVKKETTGVARNTYYESMLMRQVAGREAEQKRKAEEAQRRAEETRISMEKSQREAKERFHNTLVASYLIRHFPDAFRDKTSGALIRGVVFGEVSRLSEEAFNQFLRSEKIKFICSNSLAWGGFAVAFSGFIMALVVNSFLYCLGIPAGIFMGMFGHRVFSPRHQLNMLASEKGGAE
ncbi:MAG: hypothetical protein Q7R73_03280 [bacterium]|nr:hypothetical protein [bacterium]